MYQQKELPLTIFKKTLQKAYEASESKAGVYLIFGESEGLIAHAFDKIKSKIIKSQKREYGSLTHADDKELTGLLKDTDLFGTKRVFGLKNFEKHFKNTTVVEMILDNHDHAVIAAVKAKAL